MFVGNGMWVTSLGDPDGYSLNIRLGRPPRARQAGDVHHAAAFPGIEHTITITHCLEDDCVVESLTMESGYYAIPQKPGLGEQLLGSDHDREAAKADGLSLMNRR